MASQESLASSVNSIDKPRDLDDAQKGVKYHAHFLRKAIDRASASLGDTASATTATTATTATPGNIDALARQHTLTMETLKQAQACLAELRHALSPKDYYQLYMAVFDHLQQLAIYIADLAARDPFSLPIHQENTSSEHTTPDQTVKNMGPKGAVNEKRDLYELVQYSTSIVPRLYLMITIGCVYAQQCPHLALDYLRDMLDLCKGVQHPTRGLFLRYYLQQMSRKLMDVLPLDDAIEFLLGNFTEMNKLWVRMQYQGPMKERPKREQERRDLRLLVGLNLVRLSQLDGLTLELYQQTVLPRILEQVVSCKDVIAQEYLMEAISQVFQDEYHLRTLDLLLQSIAKFNPQVSIKSIIIAFVDRLTSYATRLAQQHQSPVHPTQSGHDNNNNNSDSESPVATSPVMAAIPDDIKLFDVFWREISSVIRTRPDLATEDVAALLVSMMKLTLGCYPSDLGNVNQVLAFASTAFEKRHDEVVQPVSAKLVMQLITAPLDAFAMSLLNDKEGSVSLGALVQSLPFPLRRSCSLEVARSLIAKRMSLTTQGHVQRVFGEYVHTLMKDQKDGGIITGTRKTMSGDPIDWDLFEEEQGLVARLILLVGRGLEDVDEKLVLLSLLRRWILEGGQDRMSYTLQPFVLQCSQLASEYLQSASAAGDSESRTKKMAALFKLLHQTITHLSKFHPALALKLFLQPLQDNPRPFLGHEMIAYEYFVSAFAIYEDSISVTHEQLLMLSLLINTVWTVSNLGILTKENYDTLATKVALYSSRLLHKHDQARMVAKCSVMFWGRDVDWEAVEKQALVMEQEAGDATSPIEKMNAVVAGEAEYADTAAAVVDEREELTKKLLGTGLGGSGGETTVSNPALNMDDELNEGWGSTEVSPVATSTNLLKPSHHPTTTHPPKPTFDKADFEKKYVYRDAKRLLECLQKSLKIADACLDSLINAQLFVEILNWYVYWFDLGVPLVVPKYMNSLVDLVFSNLQTLQQDPTVQSLSIPMSNVSVSMDWLVADGGADAGKSPLVRIEEHFLHTLEYMRELKARAGTAGESAWRLVVFEQVLDQVFKWLHDQE